MLMKSGVEMQGLHSNGVFYDLVVCGSDAERHPEAYASQIARHVPENLYGYSDATFTKKGPSNYTISQYGNAKGTWESLYAIIATTNTLISAVKGLLLLLDLRLRTDHLN